MKYRFLRIIYLLLAFVFLGIGAIGVVVPILPTTPFLLLASFFFARGSKRFNDWFLSTKLYEKYLEDFVRTRSMTLKNKLSILIPVSVLLILTFILVDNLHARIAIGSVFLLKYYYFFFHIETIEEDLI